MKTRFVLLQGAIEHLLELEISCNDNKLNLNAKHKVFITNHLINISDYNLFPTVCSDGVTLKSCHYMKNVNSSFVSPALLVLLVHLKKQQLEDEELTALLTGLGSCQIQCLRN